MSPRGVEKHGKLGRKSLTEWHSWMSPFPATFPTFSHLFLNLTRFLNSDYIFIEMFDQIMLLILLASQSHYGDVVCGKTHAECIFIIKL
jgi:hypothetical protein